MRTCSGWIHTLPAQGDHDHDQLHMHEDDHLLWVGRGTWRPSPWYPSLSIRIGEEKVRHSSLVSVGNGVAMFGIGAKRGGTIRLR
jgi:hypothetical protein